MKKQLATASRALPCALLAICAAHGSALQAQDPIPAPLQDRLPRLGEQSSWAQDTRYEGSSPDKSRRGVYPVGNGRVFGYLGLGARANTVQGLTGPHYQTDALRAPRGHFGGLTLELRTRAAPVELPRQRLRRVLDANFVVSEDAAPGSLALRTLTFAPPDSHDLYRVVTVRNDGHEAVAGLRLRATCSGEAEAGADGLLLRYVSSKRPVVAQVRLSGASVAGASLVAELGTLAPGAAWQGVLVLRTADGREPPAAWASAEPDVESAEDAAKATLAWWQHALAGTLVVDTDHRKLRDLVRDWKVMVLALRDAESGVVVPMINDRVASVRESIGPMLLLLRLHLWDRARAMLEFFYRATRLLNEIPTRTRLDLDFSALPADTDWTKVVVPAPEVPSWLILLHFWYWRATRDTALIREHWPLLEVCLKRQERGADNTMAFSGSEPWLTGPLSHLFPDTIGDGSGLLAYDPSAGRSGSSLVSSVLFVLAVQGMGEMADGIDRAANPERWKKGKPDDAPGRGYLERGFSLMRELEKSYWIEDLGFFAPALSPVNGEPHRQPFANANLMPLWAGWTFPTGEKSRDNLRNSLARLWRKGFRIGSTPSVGYATGEVGGMLLCAISDRDGRARMDCFDALLDSAGPAGEWGDLYAPDGRPIAGRDPHWPDRCRPLASGINVDALLFAINGVRYAAVPNWDNTDIRVKLRLPHGATFVNYKDIEKDGRRLRIYTDEVHKALTAAEREENAKLSPDKRRDPTAPLRRFHFRIEQLSENPPRGYWDLGANSVGTMFVRYLLKERPIDEMEFWADDHLEFLPTGDGPQPGPQPIQPADGASILFLGCRAAGAELIGTDGVQRVDTGLPLGAAELADLLVDGTGQPRFHQLVLDWEWNRVGPATYKTAAFWGPRWQKALAAFRNGGGVVVQAEYAPRARLRTAAGTREITAQDGRLTGEAGGTLSISFAAENTGDAVLRIGSGCGLTARWNGRELYRRQGARPGLPDSDAQLVNLQAGTNVLELDLGPEGQPAVFARITDARGLPVAGVRPGS